jgi:large subunit ribosomal protein L35
MPKMKTKSGAKKRFKVTAGGKVKCQASRKRHGMINRSTKFIRNARGTMVLSDEDAKIVEAIVSLGHSFGLRTTAEGIETREVLDRLMQLGCETGQGFLFCRPVAVAVPGDELSDKRQIA